MLVGLALILPLTEESSLGEVKRRIALRVPDSWLSLPEIERMSGWARRSGIEIDVGGEAAPVPPGGEAVFIGAVPSSALFQRRLKRFPLRVEERSFFFDGRNYAKAEDAIAVSSPARPREVFVLSNSPRAAVRLVSRHIFWGDSSSSDYLVISGDLVKEGKFLPGPAPLAIDRGSDRDEIAGRESFVRSQETIERGGIRWRFRESERGAVARWEPVLRRFLSGRRVGSILVRLFPDPATKARVDGSSRPADLTCVRGEVVVDVDVSAPPEPDCITPLLASAVFAAEDEPLASRPILLWALGARAAGRWWGRSVRGFASFAHAAGVAPTPEQILRADGQISPILAVGAAASWIEAGAQVEGEAAVRRALTGSEIECARSLARWAQHARMQRVVAPPRRPLPAGFLRGISYAMTNSIGGCYASPRSRETLARLARMSVNSISVMPYAWQREADAAEISFVHRSPNGETDEGTVRAVCDARALAMTALVKPQIWIGGGQFVGELAMKSEERWRLWFDAYRRFIVHHALVSEASGAAIFCLGTELVGTEGRRQQWLDTIAAVRLATGAALTYASNWAAGAPRVPFWDALDAVGVDFYDPLSHDINATDGQLDSGARQAAAPLVEIARRTGKPILFTEAGYPPVGGAWLEPHNENTGRPRQPLDAARAISAVFRTFERESWWRGVYWWKAFSDGHGARPDDRGYNLLGAPAEKAVAEGFARLAAENRASR